MESVRGAALVVEGKSGLKIASRGVVASWSRIGCGFLVITWVMSTTKSYYEYLRSVWNDSHKL